MVYLSFLAVADAGGIANWVEQNAALGYQLDRTGGSDEEVSSGSSRSEMPIRLTGGRLGNSTTSRNSPSIAAIYCRKVESIKSVRFFSRETFADQFEEVKPSPSE